MKKLFSLFILSILVWGCGPSIDTVNLPPEERLKVATDLYNDEDYEEAVKEFEALILQYPGNAIIDDAQYYLGMTRFKREEYILAAFEFSKLIKNMPASEYIPQAQFMLAESYFQLSPDYSLDQKYTQKAIEEFQAFIDFFPTNEKVPEADQKIGQLNNKLAHKEYNSAVIYEKMEYNTAALLYYENVIEVYHDTPYAPLAMYNKIKILISKDRNSEALAEINKFLDRYPESSEVSEIKNLKERLENMLSASR